MRRRGRGVEPSWDHAALRTDSETSPTLSGVQMRTLSPLAPIMGMIPSDTNQINTACSALTGPGSPGSQSSEISKSWGEGSSGCPPVRPPHRRRRHPLTRCAAVFPRQAAPSRRGHPRPAHAAKHRRGAGERAQRRRRSCLPPRCGAPEPQFGAERPADMPAAAGPRDDVRQVRRGWRGGNPRLTVIGCPRHRCRPPQGRHHHRRCPCRLPFWQRWIAEAGQTSGVEQPVQSR